MASYKTQKKIYGRSCVVDPSTVLYAIFESEKFDWSWCETTSGVHHTAIVFYLDYEARFTVNWTPKNGTKMGSILFETEGQLVFEDERLKDQNDMDYKPGVQEIDLISTFCSEDDRQLDEFLCLIDKLSRFNFEKYENKDDKGDASLYDISSCNCRDHVESVLRDVLPNGPLLLHMLSDIQNIRRRPVELGLYRAAAFMGGFMSAFGNIASLFTSADRRLRFWEKMKAKAEGPLRDFSSCFTDPLLV